MPSVISTRSCVPAEEVLTYRRRKYNLDHLCPGRALFELYDRTGDVRYKMALDTLYAQLQAQPRNADGGFWHKEVYPHQMWLDGLYMAQPSTPSMPCGTSPGASTRRLSTTS